MIVLALDTCLGACSAAVVRDGRPLASRSQAMARGHQERLAPLVKELMCQARLDFAAIDLIAVTVGPGSFTGLRVGIAFAKGLALALERPCVGVGTLEALAAGTRGEEFRAAVIDAGRERLYVQAFAGPSALTAPQSLPHEAAAELVSRLSGSDPCLLVGPAASLLAASVPNALASDLAAPRPEVVARLGAAAGAAAPHPLYLRAPDAVAKAR